MSIYYSKIAGVTFNNEGSNTENRQQIISQLLKKGLLDPGQELKLVPDPGNRFNPSAVAVYGPDGRMLGYLPNDLANGVSEELKKGISFRAYVEQVTGGDMERYYGVNIRLEYGEHTAEPDRCNTAPVKNVQIPRNAEETKRNPFLKYLSTQDRQDLTGIIQKQYTDMKGNCPLNPSLGLVGGTVFSSLLVLIDYLESHQNTCTEDSLQEMLIMEGVAFLQLLGEDYMMHVSDAVTENHLLTREEWNMACYLIQQQCGGDIEKMEFCSTYSEPDAVHFCTASTRYMAEKLNTVPERLNFMECCGLRLYPKEHRANQRFRGMIWQYILSEINSSENSLLFRKPGKYSGLLLQKYRHQLIRLSALAQAQMNAWHQVLSDLHFSDQYEIPADGEFQCCILHSQECQEVNKALSRNDINWIYNRLNITPDISVKELESLYSRYTAGEKLSESVFLQALQCSDFKQLLSAADISVLSDDILYGIDICTMFRILALTRKM